MVTYYDVMTKKYYFIHPSIMICYSLIYFIICVWLSLKSIMFVWYVQEPTVARPQLRLPSVNTGQRTIGASWARLGVKTANGHGQMAWNRLCGLTYLFNCKCTGWGRGGVAERERLRNRPFSIQFPGNFFSWGRSWPHKHDTFKTKPYTKYQIY